MANETSLNVTAKRFNDNQKVYGPTPDPLESYHIGPVVINPINVNYNGLYFLKEAIPYTFQTWTHFRAS